MRQSGNFRSRSAGVDTDPWAHENALAGVVIDDKRCFPCQQCGFIFGMRSNLKRHILTVHEDRRIFRCDLCSASFGLKQNLVTHVRVKHERRRPFSCIICGLTFGYKQVLQNHVRNIHDKRQFENDQAQWVLLWASSIIPTKGQGSTFFHTLCMHGMCYQVFNLSYRYWVSLFLSHFNNPSRIRESSKT
jgi:hypothetical protein